MLSKSWYSHFRKVGSLKIKIHSIARWLPAENVHSSTLSRLIQNNIHSIIKLTYWREYPFPGRLALRKVRNSDPLGTISRRGTATFLQQFSFCERFMEMCESRRKGASGNNIHSVELSVSGEDFDLNVFIVLRGTWGPLVFLSWAQFIDQAPPNGGLSFSCTLHIHVRKPGLSGYGILPCGSLVTESLK
jgi:hypothetical protein